MHILFLTQVLPYPLDAGPKIRAYYTIRYLSQQHEVTLLSFVRPGDPPEAVKYLRSFCQAVHTVPMRRSRARDAWHLLHSLASDTPFLITRDWVPEMAKQISDFAFRISHFDFIHADQLWMAPYALLAKSQTCPERSRRIANRKSKTVLDQHNAVYLVPKRLAEHERNPLKHALLELEWRKMAHYEAETCQRFDRVVWVTLQDYQAVQRRIPDSRSQILNSAVIPICGDPEATPIVARRADARRVTFLGGLHYPPNAQGVLWFAKQVFPLVLAQVPDAVLTVIGKSPPRQILDLRSQIPESSLEMTGYVADPKPYLAETAVFVVPLLAGGGMRVKVVDAWMWGLPVVSTTTGAEGIETRPGENILLADTPEAFAQATVHLLHNPDEGQRLAQAGRQWVEQRYNWRTVYRLWDQVYAGLGASR